MGEDVGWWGSVLAAGPVEGVKGSVSVVLPDSQEAAARTETGRCRRVQTTHAHREARVHALALHVELKSETAGYKPLPPSTC